MILASHVMVRLDRAITTNNMASNDGPVEPDDDEVQEACTSMHKCAGIITARTHLRGSVFIHWLSPRKFLF